MYLRCFASILVDQGLWQLISVVLQEWDNRRWSQGQLYLSHVKSAGGRDFRLRLSSRWMAVFTHSTNNALRPSLQRHSDQWPATLSKRFTSVSEQCLLAFSASSQYSHRFNSETSAILVCSTLKQKRWQLLPHRYRAT